MNRVPTGGQERPTYVAPRITSYTESEVADTLGPVLLSGNGSDLGVLEGNESPSPDNTGRRPRR